jgi:rare lipoprotein A
MYVPATLALHTTAVAPAEVLAAGEAPKGQVGDMVTLENTALGVRRADLNVLAGQTATVTGVLLAAPGAVGGHAAPLAEKTVVLQVRERGRWRTIAGTRTGDRGRYRLRYKLRRIGSEVVRMRFAGDAEDRGSHRRLGRLNVFRVVGASWYGGGGSLACGGWLTSSTLGVANKTLPCGTRVTLRYDGRSVRVPVVDRGPYVEGREFDLTEATKRALGFEGAGDVWATA